MTDVQVHAMRVHLQGGRPYVLMLPTSAMEFLAGGDYDFKYNPATAAKLLIPKDAEPDPERPEEPTWLNLLAHGLKDLFGPPESISAGWVVLPLCWVTWRLLVVDVLLREFYWLDPKVMARSQGIAMQQTCFGPDQSFLGASADLG